MTEDELDDLLGRGDGDPDFHTPPWEKPNIRYIGEDKAVVERSYEIKGRSEGWPWNADEMDYDPRMDEDLEEA